MIGVDSSWLGRFVVLLISHRYISVHSNESRLKALDKVWLLSLARYRPVLVAICYPYASYLVKLCCRKASLPIVSRPGVVDISLTSH